MSSPLFRWLTLALIAAVALALRTYQLDRRPMHADEANQAVKLGELIESGRYAFDPLDHHGPTLYYAALPLAWLRNETTLASLSETTVRLVPALAGTFAVLLLAALVWPTGVGRALTAAALFAVSPPAVYYSRYFIQETLLLTFTLAALVCAQRWWRSGLLAWALGAGACAGLMQATKASAPLFAGAALVALIAARATRPAAVRPWRDFVFALGAAGCVAALFYSSFGRNPSGLRDAIAAYGPGLQRASTGAGQEKPWWYFIALFGGQETGGLFCQQLIFSALALAGAVIAHLRPQKFLRWTAAYTAIVAAILSLTPYKTPWHAIHLVPGLAVLAAAAIASIPRQWLSGVVAVVVLGTQLSQTRLVAFTRPSDPRNPYAYVHSSPDVLKFRPLVEAALARSPQGVVRVIGEEYWPLPWYFRGLPRIGYWSTPLGNCDGALIIATAGQADAVRAQLHDQYTETFLGLRPGVLCVLFTPRP